MFLRFGSNLNHYKLCQRYPQKSSMFVQPAIKYTQAYSLMYAIHLLTYSEFFDGKKFKFFQKLQRQQFWETPPKLKKSCFIWKVNIIVNINMFTPSEHKEQKWLLSQDVFTSCKLWAIQSSKDERVQGLRFSVERLSSEKKKKNKNGSTPEGRGCSGTGY